MRAVLQRVKNCTVTIDQKIHSSIGDGFLILLGVEESDADEDVDYLAGKICQMRIFSDPDGKMNLDIKQKNGEMMIVSQFTLYASIKKGNRPSFIKAARPEKAIPLYEKFILSCNAQLQKQCKTGVFGADMQINLINDGPVTILLDSKSRE